MNIPQILNILDKIDDTNLKLFTDFCGWKNVWIENMNNLIIFLGKLLNTTNDEVQINKIQWFLNKAKNIREMELIERNDEINDLENLFNF